MSRSIVIDPVTRIEGHLRIEASLDAKNSVTEAYSSGTMVRGIETILKGRDPREAWAFAQRVCGVCTSVHALASVRSVEDALGIKIPRAARLIRNMMTAQQYVHDHVMHFYILHALDFVDVAGALKADPGKTSEIQQSISSWPNSSPGYFAAVQKKIRTIFSGGSRSLFSRGYWGHPAYRLPPELDLLVLAHYLECLDWQSRVTKIHTIFGGKNPHPNYVVGGVPLPIVMDGGRALNAEKLSVIADSIKKLNDFVDMVYIPDLLAIVPHYPEYAGLGEGLGNFLTWGEFPAGDIADPANFVVPRAAILERDLKNLIVPDPGDFEKMKEYVSRSWYAYDEGDGTGLFPGQGETAFNYTGPEPPYERLNVKGKYSWIKAPRWNDKPMEVGPLARVLVMYASGHKATVELVNTVLETLEAPVSALFSTLGRTAARGIETKVFGDLLPGLYGELAAEIRAGNTATFDGRKWEPRTWPERAEGFGFCEAPRGALGHWIVIESGKIKNYQMVVPTTWNASPRDHRNQPGAYEAALVGTRLAVPDQPLEILRTIHSFDPCMACAVHLAEADGRPVAEAGTGFNPVARP